MSPQEWEESPVFRRAYCVHNMRHVVEIPVTIGGAVAGNVHFATTARDWDIGLTDIRVAEALSSVVGMTIEAISGRDQIEREREGGRGRRVERRGVICFTPWCDTNGCKPSS